MHLVFTLWRLISRAVARLNRARLVAMVMAFSVLCPVIGEATSLLPPHQEVALELGQTDAPDPASVPDAVPLHHQTHCLSSAMIPHAPCAPPVVQPFSVLKFAAGDPVWVESTPLLPRKPPRA